MLKGLKTSQKMSAIFSIFNVLSLLLLLLSINIIYFFIWYTDQKAESMYDMNINYKKITGKGKNNIDAFQKYILQKDSIIIPKKGGALVCSEGVAKKLHNNMELVESVKNSLFYKDQGKIYLIFSKKYEDIGEVKILFDTTSYIKSQIIIIKVSCILIIFFLILYFFIGKRISEYALKNLKQISRFASELDLNTKGKKIIIDGPDDDEIKIVASVLNSAVDKIRKQSKNQKQFITDVSHEFKTPLMVVNSKIDVYMKKREKGLCGENEVPDLLLEIKKNTGKLNKLLETLFLISRFGDGIIKFKREKLLLSGIIQEVSIGIIKSSGKKMSIDMKVQKEIYKKIELSTYTILLENLLTNAIKFSAENSTIEVGLDDKKMWIKDSGIGIEAGELEKVFQKFYRKDESIEGFGVGLFMVKRIVDLYSWKIELQSTQGKGSNCIILF